MMDLREPSDWVEQAAFSACLEDLNPEAADPWSWSSRIRHALGEDGELDPGMLEESWASGRPVSEEVFRVKHGDVSASDGGFVPYGALNVFGGFCMPQAGRRAEEQEAHSILAYVADSYRADWLYDLPQKQASVHGNNCKHEAVDERSAGDESPKCVRAFVREEGQQRNCDQSSVSANGERVAS